MVWFFEDEPITTTTGSEIQIETTDNYTALRIPKAKRYNDDKLSESGFYRVGQVVVDLGWVDFDF